MMLYRFSRWRTLMRTFTSGFGLAETCLQNVRVYQQTKLRSYNSVQSWVRFGKALWFKSTPEVEFQCGLWRIFDFPSVLEKTHPPHWNSTSGLDSDHILYWASHSATICQISSKSDYPQRSLWCYIDFQDGCRCGAILLPVLEWLTSLSWEGPYISKPNFIVRPITQSKSEI